MKKTILTIAVMLGGVNLLMATGFEDLKASAADGFAVDVAGLKKGAAVLPEPAATAVDNKAGNVFQGGATWKGSNGFGALEQLGVRKSAEENAVAKCQAQGLSGCVAIGSTISECNTYKCSATATAIPLIPVSGAVVFSAASKYSGSSGFGALERLGVRKAAEEQAVAKCQTQGLLGCVAIGSTISECDTYKCAATGMAQVQTSPK